MKELVYKSEKGTPVTTSLLVAEKFGKEHKHVLEAIRTLAENSADLPGIKNMSSA
jgi:anti-repressor protein